MRTKVQSLESTDWGLKTSDQDQRVKTWTVVYRPWTLDYGLWTLDEKNRFSHADDSSDGPA